MVVPSGSAGTHAGIIAGMIGNNINIPVTGIGVNRPKPVQENAVHTLANQTLDLLGVEARVPAEKVVAFDDYVGPGYSLPTDAMVEAVKMLAETEGILPVGNKGRLMQELGMCRIPCIVLESKAYSPGDSDALAASMPWIRWNQDSDNPAVGQCLVQAAQQCHAQAVVNDRAYPRRPGDLDRASRALGEKIARLGQEYANARTSAQKVALAAVLADILEQEIGGTSFMSQAVHTVAAGGGLWPGQAAMLSLLASREEYRSLKVMITTRKELELLADIALAAAVLLRDRLPEASSFIQARSPQPEPERLLHELCLPS